MFYLRFFKITSTFCIALFLRQMPFAVAQDIPVSAEILGATENEVTADGIEPLKITVDVQEVRLDVVVLDGRGRPITDLTADDFEVYQDNRKMKVTSSVYIDYQASAAERSSAFQKASPYLPKISDALLENEDVRRTILFVVDNISMEYQRLAGV